VSLLPLANNVSRILTDPWATFCERNYKAKNIAWIYRVMNPSNFKVLEKQGVIEWLNGSEIQDYGNFFSLNVKNLISASRKVTYQKFSAGHIVLLFLLFFILFFK